MRRSPFLQPISREHHHTLLLCWKIRAGFKKKVEVERIKVYADWFFKNYILPHFKIEEAYVFPVLGNDNELVKKAKLEHKRLKRLFNQDDDITKSLSLIEEELEKHIRFEERVLFNEIQEIASPSQIMEINKRHNDHGVPAQWKDEFWV